MCVYTDIHTSILYIDDLVIFFSFCTFHVVFTSGLLGSLISCLTWLAIRTLNTEKKNQQI